MNMHTHGTPVTGAPGSIARKQSETEDLLRGLLYATQDLMDHLSFHVQTGRFRPSQSTVAVLTKVRDRFNEAKNLVTK